MKKTVWMRTEDGRIARNGILEDDYSETSGCKRWNKIDIHKNTQVRFPSDKRTPESLNGPVIIVQEGRKKDGK